MTIQPTTTTAGDAIDEARERFTPVAERLVDAADRVMDTLAETVRDTVAPTVVGAATQVREQVAPKVADKIADALGTAADRVAAHGTNGSGVRRSRWKPVAIGVCTVAGTLVVIGIVRARRAAGAWENDTRSPSGRPDEQEIKDPNDAKLAETVDVARTEVAIAADAAAGQVTDVTDRARSTGRKR